MKRYILAIALVALIAARPAFAQEEDDEEEVATLEEEVPAGGPSEAEENMRKQQQMVVEYIMKSVSSSCRAELELAMMADPTEQSLSESCRGEINATVTALQQQNQAAAAGRNLGQEEGEGSGAPRRRTPEGDAGAIIAQVLLIILALVGGFVAYAYKANPVAPVDPVAAAKAREREEKRVKKAMRKGKAVPADE